MPACDALATVAGPLFGILCGLLATLLLAAITAGFVALRRHAPPRIFPGHRAATAAAGATSDLAAMWRLDRQLGVGARAAAVTRAHAATVPGRQVLPGE